jgi:hypothetical protein
LSGAETLCTPRCLTGVVHVAGCCAECRHIPGPGCCGAHVDGQRQQDTGVMAGHLHIWHVCRWVPPGGPKSSSALLCSCRTVPLFCCSRLAAGPCLWKHQPIAPCNAHCSCTLHIHCIAWAECNPTQGMNTSPVFLCGMLFGAPMPHFRGYLFTPKTNASLLDWTVEMCLLCLLLQAPCPASYAAPQSC